VSRGATATGGLGCCGIRILHKRTWITTWTWTWT
jgi:hypothetical protein